MSASAASPAPAVSCAPPCASAPRGMRYMRRSPWRTAAKTLSSLRRCARVSSVTKTCCCVASLLMAAADACSCGAAKRRAHAISPTVYRSSSHVPKPRSHGRSMLPGGRVNRHVSRQEETRQQALGWAIAPRLLLSRCPARARTPCNAARAHGGVSGRIGARRPLVACGAGKAACCTLPRFASSAVRQARRSAREARSAAASAAGARCAARARKGWQRHAWGRAAPRSGRDCRTAPGRCRRRTGAAYGCQ